MGLNGAHKHSRTHVFTLLNNKIGVKISNKETRRIKRFRNMCQIMAASSYHTPVGFSLLVNVKNHGSAINMDY